MSIHVELEAYVLPDGHRAFKLFPGKSYKLNKQILEARAAFLDIRGLGALPGDRQSWDDTRVKEIIRTDRLLRNAESAEKQTSAQDTKRLKFLKGLLFDARKGDLVVVPLGRGLDGDVAIGEFATEPGVLQRVRAIIGGVECDTWARPINWRANVKRRRFSNDLNSRLHAPTALHTIEASLLEEVYLAAYGSFTYDNVYVASFPSDKEHFTTTDQARIGIWFNGMSVAYQNAVEGREIDPETSFLELGMEDGDVDFDLARNSPISGILRTIGPLAFAIAATYPMAVEGATITEVKTATVSAKPVAGAEDKCKVVVPPHLDHIATGLGFKLWQQSCRNGKRVQEGATMRPMARLKRNPEPHK